jgi:hypothetical protein
MKVTDGFDPELSFRTINVDTEPLLSKEIDEFVHALVLEFIGLIRSINIG